MNFYTFNSTLRSASAETFYLQSKTSACSAHNRNNIARLPKPIKYIYQVLSYMKITVFSILFLTLIPRELSLTILILNHIFYKWAWT